MHNASTKQRLAALRRKLGIFTGWQPRWVKERRKRLERLEAALAAERARTDLTASGASAELVPAAAPEPDLAPPPTGTATLFAPPPRAPTFAGPPPGFGTAVAPQATTELVTPPVEEATSARAAIARPGTALAPEPPRSRAVRRGVAGALVLAAIVAAIFSLWGRAPAPERSAAAAAAAAPRALERAAERDARVAAAVAAPAAPLERALAGGREASTVQVRRGDTLWHIAGALLGDPMRWPELHAANAGQIRDPDLIFPGQELRVPGSPRK